MIEQGDDGFAAAVDGPGMGTRIALRLTPERSRILWRSVEGRDQGV